MNEYLDFRPAFAALTRRTPFPWQERAFATLVSGDTPTCVALPTGTGKTSFIPIWLIALACQAASGRVSLPRRLVWVVDRRVVVDQATDEAERLIDRLTSPVAAAPKQRRILSEIAERIAAISLLGGMGQPPVAISTLRGQKADNGDWKLDPSRPAIVIGTVDMIGSRLLFSGYGDGKYKRPLHAGLLGQDAWMVLDEAHLTPAFAALLQAIHTEQCRNRNPRSTTWRFSLLSATQRDNSGESFGLTQKDEDSPVIGQRLKAAKSLFIHELNEKEDELEHIAQRALDHKEQRKRVIVFVKSPEDANKLAARIGKEHDDPEAVLTLTGTQRGFERDKLALNPVFAGFRSNSQRKPPSTTHYLVATAAGEVGADLDADHLVCDLAPLDSLIQRFGRVNRLGLGTARVDLVVSGKQERNEQKKALRTATLDYLRSLPKDGEGGHSVSPADLTDPPRATFSATPEVIPLGRHWLDIWSLTSIGKVAWPDRPEVAPWLHGVVDNLPETWLVWRDEVEWLGDKDQVSDEDCKEAFDAFPILPEERLREPTNRIRQKLKELARQRTNAQQPILLSGTDGAISWRGTLQDLVTKEGTGELNLAFSTVLLPTAVGGLSDQGMFDPSCTTATDIAEENQHRHRFFIVGDEAEAHWQAFRGTHPSNEPAHIAPTRKELIDEIAETKGLKPVALVRLGRTDEDAIDEEDTERHLLYLAEATSLADSHAKSFIAARPEPLADHLQRVGWTARKLVERIAEADSPLNALGDALGIAGNRHDTGKDRSCWQRAIGNQDPDNPLAKSGRDRFIQCLNGGYRHEFGALIDATKALSREQKHRDLILHLIAAHHGNARPYFRERAYDRESPLDTCRNAAARTLQRFGHLQDRHGWWGIAYLEAILKAADTLVSAGLIQEDTANDPD